MASATDLSDIMHTYANIHYVYYWKVSHIALHNTGNALLQTTSYTIKSYCEIGSIFVTDLP